MATKLKEALWAKLSSDSELLVLLGSPTAKPWNIYKAFGMHTTETDGSFLVLQELGRNGDWPTSIVVAVTAYSQYPDPILNKVRSILEYAVLSCSEFYTFNLFYEGSSAELHDDKLDMYYRQDRYEMKVLTK